MLSETVTASGDKDNLAYIRDRYNVLLTRKDGLEAAIRHGKYTTTDLALLIETQAEMMRIDDARTGMVNVKLLSPVVTNIKIVTLKQKTDLYQLLVEKKTAPGKYCSHSNKHREVKQVIVKGKYKQKNLITI